MSYLPYQANGITLSPEARYAELVSMYPSFQQRVGGGGQQQAQQSSGYPDLFASMGLSGLFGTPAQTKNKPTGPTNKGGAFRNRGNAQGASNGYPSYETMYPGVLPPATTQPQTPVQQPAQQPQQAQPNPMDAFASYTNPITAGLLGQNFIDQASQTLKSGANRQATGNGYQLNGAGNGIFGQLMQQKGNAANTSLIRDAAQQQAEMQQAHDMAKSGAGLQQQGILAALNRENVTNDVAQRNAMINIMSALLNGFN